VALALGVRDGHRREFWRFLRHVVSKHRGNRRTPRPLGIGQSIGKVDISAPREAIDQVGAEPAP
jgi:hypothetical protein